jgi:hypothetical protein
VANALIDLCELESLIILEIIRVEVHLTHISVVEFVRLEINYDQTAQPAMKEVWRPWITPRQAICCSVFG